MFPGSLQDVVVWAILDTGVDDIIASEFSAGGEPASSCPELLSHCCVSAVAFCGCHSAEQEGWLQAGVVEAVAR